MPPTIDPQYPLNLANFAKTKRELLGDGQVMFGATEIRIFPLEEIVLLLNELHLVAVGDVPSDMIREPVADAVEARLKFATVFTACVSHLTVTGPNMANQWLSDFLKAAEGLGATGGLGSLFSSLAMSASDEVAEASLARWLAIPLDDRVDAGFNDSLVLSPDKQGLLKAFEPREMNRMMGVGGWKQYFSERAARFGMSNEQCLSAGIVGGAIGGAIVGGLVGAVTGAEVGGLAGAAVCPWISDGDKDRNKDKKDPKDDGMIVNPADLLRGTLKPGLNATVFKGDALFGEALDELIGKGANFGQILTAAYSVCAARARVMNAHGRQQPSMGFDGGKLISAKPEALRLKRIEQTEQFTLDAAMIDVKPAGPDGLTQEPEVLDQIQDGYLLTFPGGSAAAAQYPNGFRFSNDVPLETMMIWARSILERLNSLDPRPPLEMRESLASFLSESKNNLVRSKLKVTNQ